MMVQENRRRLMEAFTLARMVVNDLRLFLDTEDTGYIERAYKIGEYIWNNKEYAGLMSGVQDLYNNLKSMYQLVKSKNGRLDDYEMGDLNHQASYTLMRANIIAMGLSFKLRRMRIT